MPQLTTREIMFATDVAIGLSSSELLRTHLSEIRELAFLGLKNLRELRFSRWLDENAHQWGTSRDNEGITVYSMCMGEEAKRLGRGKTRLQALEDAVKTLGGSIE